MILIVSKLDVHSIAELINVKQYNTGKLLMVLFRPIDGDRE